MDNIGNLKSINMVYGPLVLSIFDIIDQISLAPNLSKATWISDDNTKEQALVFNRNLGKISQNVEGSEFTLQALPFESVTFIIVYFLFAVSNWASNEIEYRERESNRVQIKAFKYKIL